MALAYLCRQTLAADSTQDQRPQRQQDRGRNQPEQTAPNEGADDRARRLTSTAYGRVVG
jgi:serine/threonine protein phosphatase PrpC